MNTFYAMWGVTTPAQAAEMIDRQRHEAGISEPRNLEEQAISLVGIDIYERLVKGYTEKQWGRDATQLPAFIIKRLPVRFTFDNNYFNDRWQGIPIGGYNKLVDGLLAGVEVRCDTDFFADRTHWESLCDRIVFTGRIDEYYDFRLGEPGVPLAALRTRNARHPQLSGRRRNEFHRARNSLHPDHRTQAFRTGRRSAPHDHYPGIPAPYEHGAEPYYPVNDQRNTKLYESYKALADRDRKVIFGGRLGEYRYYDMDKVIESALKLTL